MNSLIAWLFYFVLGFLAGLPWTAVERRGI
jgi:hypothetical protein